MWPTSKSASLLLRFSKSQPWRRGRLGRSPNFKLQTRPNSHYKNGKVIRQLKYIKYKTIRTEQITLSHLTCLCYYGGAGWRRLSVYMHALVRWVVTTCLITACVWAYTRSLFLHLYHTYDAPKASWTLSSTTQTIWSTPSGLQTFKLPIMCLWNIFC